MFRRMFLKVVGAWAGLLGATLPISSRDKSKEPDSFLAIITDKHSVSSAFGQSTRVGGLQFFGQYSWVEMEETADGEFKPKEGGRFGIVGGSDAAYEANGSNANFQSGNMVVRMLQKLSTYLFLAP